MPSGPGTQDSQIVAFAKRPDERVDILTPQQQRLKARAAGQEQAQQGGGAAPIVNVAVVMSEEQVLSAFKGSKGRTVIVRGIEAEKSAIKNVLSGA
jgi:hypothetical protein